MLEIKQLTVAIDFNSMGGGELLWKSMATSKCLVTKTPQNILFCVQLKKETQTGLE